VSTILACLKNRLCERYYNGWTNPHFKTVVIRGLSNNIITLSEWDLEPYFRTKVLWLFSIRF